MIQTTQSWKTYSVDHSNYLPLIVVMKNGNIIWSFDASNIKEGSLRFTDDVTDLGDFNVGATPSNSFECDIINFDSSFPAPDTFKGCKANLYFYIGEKPVFGGTNAVAGQAIAGQAVVGTGSELTDYIKRGVYYLDPINSVGRTVHISGSDAMSLPEFNSANMEGYSFGGKTCFQVIKEIGFNLQNTFPMSDYVLPSVKCTEEYNMGSVTKRTVLGYIASLCGCYARHDHNGELRLQRFSISESTETITVFGDSVSFDNGTDSTAEIEVQLTLEQEGSGDPSPTNIRPIKTYSEVKVHNIDEVSTITLGTEICQGTVTNYGGVFYSTKVVDLGSLTWRYSSTRKVFTAGLNDARSEPTYTSHTISNVVCEQYKSYYINNVYNGNEDLSCALSTYTVSGSLMNNLMIVDNRYTSVSSFTSAVSGIKLAYNLATTATLTIPPVDIYTHLGKNVMWSDGDISVTYEATSLPYIAKIMQEPDMAYYPVEVTGVFVSGINGTFSTQGTDGYYLFVEDNPLITTQLRADTVANNLLTYYAGLKVYPFSLSYIADPSLESGDAVIVGYNGRTIKTILGTMNYGLGQLSNIGLDTDTNEHSSAEALIASIPGTKQSVTDLYNGDTLKKIINLSENKIKIEAENIDMKGAVFVDGTINCNNNFKVSPDGSVTANNMTANGSLTTGKGQLGGWELTTIGLESTDKYVVDTSGVDPNGGIWEEITDPGYTAKVKINGYLGQEVQYGGIDEFDLLYPSGSENNVLEVKNGNAYTCALNGNGNFHAQRIRCVALSQTSDKRLKKDIKPLDHAEEFIYRLRPVKFKFKDGDKIHHGFIAQDIEDEWVVSNSDGYLTINYTEIIADLVATVQSLHKRIKELEKKDVK